MRSGFCAKRKLPTKIRFAQNQKHFRKIVGSLRSGFSTKNPQTKSKTISKNCAAIELDHLRPSTKRSKAVSVKCRTDRQKNSGDLSKFESLSLLHFCHFAFLKLFKFLWTARYSCNDPRGDIDMPAHSKPLQVCRPDQRYGPANRCNVQTGDVHFWLSRYGIIIDPTPCTIDLPPGDNVYIPWKRVPPSELPSRNEDAPAEDRCWQNVVNALPNYPGAEVMCGTLARRVAPGVLMSVYG